MKRTALKRSHKPMSKRSAKGNRIAYKDALAKIRCFRIFGSYCIFRDRVPHVCLGPIDPMHNFPKGLYPWLRFDPRNIMPGCRWLHDYFHAHPKEARQLMLDELSPTDAAKLQQLARLRR